VVAEEITRELDLQELLNLITRHADVQRTIPHAGEDVDRRLIWHVLLDEWIPASAGMTLALRRGSAARSGISLVNDLLS
jgi:hypothetical protein